MCEGSVCVSHLALLAACLCICSKPAETVCFVDPAISDDVTVRATVGFRNIKQRRIWCYCWAQLISFESMTGLLCLLESSAVLAPCLLDGTPPYGLSDSLFSPVFSSCLPPCALHTSFTCSLIWEFFWEWTKFMTQLVLIKTRQRGQSKRQKDKVFF